MKLILVLITLSVFIAGAYGFYWGSEWGRQQVLIHAFDNGYKQGFEKGREYERHWTGEPMVPMPIEEVIESSLRAANNHRRVAEVGDNVTWNIYWRDVHYSAAYYLKVAK